MALFCLLQFKSALHLELRGMKHSRGSVYALVKRELGLRGDKQAVYDQLCVLVDEAKKQTCRQTGYKPRSQTRRGT